MKRIRVYPLQPGEKWFYALVDAADHERLRKYRWYAVRRQRAKAVYRFMDRGNGMNFRTLHREVVGHVPKGKVVDHINRNPLDCRRSNLRICTPPQNNWNQGPRRNRRYSRYKNITISWFVRNGVKKTHPKPWFVLVKVGDKKHWRGMFADEKEAYDASVELLKELHGEYACIEPWQGYTDTPELREALGRKNGPPVKSTHHPDESGLSARHREMIRQD